MNNKNEKTIVWQKWVDPYDQESSNVFIPELQKAKEQENSVYDDGFKEDTLEQEIDFESIRPTKALFTPMGPIPLTEHSKPGAIFNMWIGHTNFDISQYISNIIEDTPGVEILDVHTRYRFRLAIGKVFDSTKVKLNIQERVNTAFNEDLSRQNDGSGTYS